MTSSAWPLARRGRCGPCIALMTKKVEEGRRRVGIFMQWRASSAPRRALSFLLALSYLPLAIASPSPTPDGGAFAENGTLTDDEYLYVLRLLVEDSTKLDALASLLRSEHGSWTAHAPGMLKLKMTSNKYGTVLWTDSRTTWQNFAAFKAYLSWRSCYGPIPEAAVWPYNVCEPTCNGGAANGAPLCMGSNPYASALISTKSECEAAATALDLSKKTAYDVMWNTSSHNPPGCVFFPSTGPSSYLQVTVAAALARAPRPGSASASPPRLGAPPRPI